MLIDETQQVVHRNVIVEFEVLEQRFGPGVLPHHDQKASASGSHSTWNQCFLVPRLSPSLECRFCLVRRKCGFAESNGKSDGRVEQKVIIGKVVDVPSIVIRIQSELPKEALCYAYFVVITVGRFHGETENLGVQRHDVG